MGKRRRNNELHDEQEKSNFDDESQFDSGRTGVHGKSQASKKEATGQAMEKRADLSSQSGVRKPFSWTSVQLLVVLKELSKLADSNSSKPLDNSSINWNDLAVTLGEKLNYSLTRNQVYEKARRLKEKYLKNQENAGCSDPNFFKTDDDKKMFKLSQKIWGVHGATNLKPLKNTNCDVQSAELEPGCEKNNDGQTQEPSHLTIKLQKTRDEPSVSELNVKKPPDQHLYNIANTVCQDGSNNADDRPTEQEKADTRFASQSNNHVLDEDLRSSIELFQAKQQAILIDLENSCMAVMNRMEAKFLNALSNTTRGSRSPWMGTAANLLSLDLILQNPVSTDNTTYMCSQPSGSESLARQWHEQHLQELNLTSLKLQLMLDECKREKEKLEKL